MTNIIEDTKSAFVAKLFENRSLGSAISTYRNEESVMCLINFCQKSDKPQILIRRSLDRTGRSF